MGVPRGVPNIETVASPLPPLHCLLDYSTYTSVCGEKADLSAPSERCDNEPATFLPWLEKMRWDAGPMSGKTVNRADLCQALYQKVGLSRTESATLLELVLKEITDCLERGETVKLSSFGSFVVRKKGQRMGRNPRTGEEALISPRRIVMFKPSDTLKQRINASRSAFQ
jgi:integration host factor subunit alpha